MALKFLNKKGWHTGSLRNIENVWKAEQKHEAEQQKLEELKKQIREERERADFRQLQEEAGLISKQERLEFLYDSGLAVGKTSGFKTLEPKTEQESGPSSSASGKQDSAVPGALFEEKQISSNDAWRKLHSDPLLLICQREQEALARIKNNPIKMAMIRKSVESEKGKGLEEKKTRRHEKKRRKHSSSENDSDSDSRDSSRRSEKRRDGHYKGSEKSSRRTAHTSDDESVAPGKKYHERDNRTERHGGHREDEARQRSKSGDYKESRNGNSDKPPRYDSRNKRRNTVQLSEEERAAKLREMQLDAEVHEQQRWKLLKKAADKDKEEAARDEVTHGRSFLDATQKSIYGAEKGGSSTIEESVRRRAHFSQGRSANETNAFRRS